MLFNLTKIKKIREAFPMTQAELHRKTGLSITTISNIENGHRTFVHDLTMEKITKALKVEAAELLM